MNNLPISPIFKSFVYKWLKAGFIYLNKYEDYLTGTPQGGNISPVISNFVMDGLKKTVKKSVEYFYKSQRWKIHTI